MTSLAHIGEIALLLLAAYLAGCVIGYVAHRVVRARIARALAPTIVAPAAKPAQISPARRLARAANDEPLVLPAAPRVARPPELPAPLGKADDLRQIKGIGAKTESSLHDLGIWHFSQIAAWQPAHIDWLEGRIAIKGRIRREQWVEQATLLATATSAAA